MYIHAGNRKIVSDKRIIGIFNIDTIKMSKTNKRFFKEIKSADKTIIIERNNGFFTTGVSPYTIITRTEPDYKAVWRREND